MAIQSRPITVEEFERIAALPENADRRLEYIAGEIIELVSSNYASIIASRVNTALGIQVEGNDLGYLTIADGGYWVAGNRFMPDVAFISKARQPEPCRETWNPLAPDLAVEVVSPTDELKNVLDKVTTYLAAGTTVWVFFPDQKEVSVYENGQPPKKFGANDTLDGGKILPGFKLPLKNIYKE
jgi:Uma2 family endonuclease